ncbi:MAG: hypothetical protein IJZ72_06745 [Oscillospiraceae bacterium]|nr:hypothetical protein [Oscillospiraceae bacterium]
MNITSVSNQQLYNIVTGNKFAWIHGDVTKAKEYTEQELLEMSQKSIDTASIGSLVKSGVSNMDNFTIPDSDLARHLGEMGKRIDSAYKEGSLSEEDYKQLCAELENYTDEAVYNVEYKRCAKIARQDNPLNIIGIYSKETLTDTRHQVLEMMKKAQEASQPWQVDRNNLMKMIIGIRYGVTEI